MKNIFQHNTRRDKALLKGTNAIFAIVAVAIMLIGPVTISNDSDAATMPQGVPTGPEYGIVITQDASGEAIGRVEYSSSPGSSSWKTLSTMGYNEAGEAKQRHSSYDDPGFSEELKFDATTGLGPFNSFYAAMNLWDNSGDGIEKFSSEPGQLAFILNPLDLTKPLGVDTTFPADRYNVMLFIPTVYWYSDSTHIYMSNSKTFFSDGTYKVNDANMKAYAHTVGGEVKPYIALGVYEGSVMDVGGVSLVSVADRSPTTNKNISYFREATNNLNMDGMGGEYMLWNYYQWTLHKLMSYTVMGTKNSQVAVGMGIVGTGYSKVTGSTASKAPYYGTTSTEVSVKVFIENSWGNVIEFVDDFWLENGVAHVGQNNIGRLIDSAAANHDYGFNDTLQHRIGSAAQPSEGMITATSTSPGNLDFPTHLMPGHPRESPIGTNAHFSDGKRHAIVGGYYSSSDTTGISRIFGQDNFGIAKNQLGARIAYYADRFTVTYEKGNTGDESSTGATPIDSKTYIRGDHVTVLDNTGGLTNEDPHKVFYGWTTVEGDYSTLYDPGDVMIFPQLNMTLYSYWDYPQRTVTLYFDVDGGSHEVHPIVGSVGETIHLPGYTGVKYGYDFAGWYDPLNETYHKAHTQYHLHHHDMTLVAVWSANGHYDDSEDEDDILEILKLRSAAQRNDTGSGLNVWWLVVAVAAVAVASAAVLASTWIKKRSRQRPAPQTLSKPFPTIPIKAPVFCWIRDGK